ncbi:hypothetical protein FKR81_39595 [Lentzea tibetensis]|uniref:Uncharacterized protein n=1 Tax=Lentzea tibetensis TaxID=2591470 RepID=A0A563EGF9_9PSEU|nr:hypothetical protein [Lentzea tibetensis]TWP45189.1 hypothetical protein FKR81_39595 [Lentzea tibetensis]
MFKTAAAVCAAAALSLAASPLAHASDEPSPVSIDLDRGMGMGVDREGTWTANTFGYFTVDLSDAADENLDEVSVFVSVPDAVEVADYSGDDWDCWDVDGGIECHNPQLMVPGEAWPTLTVHLYVHDHMDDVGSIDVYATTGDFGPAHEGVPFQTNTRV